MNHDEVVVRRFNDAINARDIGELGELMTSDHAFIDAANSRIDGREACLGAWHAFFAAFPRYQNRFDRVDTVGAAVVVSGWSECSVVDLNGAALWRALVKDDQVQEWQVYDATPENRELLGLTG